MKGLSFKYGIDCLLEAVALLNTKGEIPIQLRIAGKGPQEKEYHRMAEYLGISDITTWLGFINQEDAAKEWANMDVAVIPSVQESFGVSAVEAQASGTPVIISDVPGLMEATIPKKTSIVIEQRNSEQLAKIISELYYDRRMQERLSYNGREFVENKYELNACFYKIEKLLMDRKYQC